jgi:hypothetical protein
MQTPRRYLHRDPDLVTITGTNDMLRRISVDPGSRLATTRSSAGLASGSQMRSLSNRVCHRVFSSERCRWPGRSASVTNGITVALGITSTFAGSNGTLTITAYNA